MPHIHTEPGQVDFTTSVLIVYQDKVLLRLHEKHHIWLMPGGHIELDETPEDAAVREVKEEVGLDVTLWRGNQPDFSETVLTENYRELLPPAFINVHRISDTHRHIDLVYFAIAAADVIYEPETAEKSGGCRWLTREELMAATDVEERIKQYGAKALETLVP
jgi:8-oxo-dGTP pyrophosphatase MutT (NUDIX family)